MIGTHNSEKQSTCITGMAISYLSVRHIRIKGSAIAAMPITIGKIIKDAILTSWRYASMERDLSSFIELSIGYETWPIMVVTVSEGNLIKLSPLL